MTAHTSPPFALGMFDAGNGSFVGVVRGDRVLPLLELFGAGRSWPAELPAPSSLYALLPMWDAVLDAIERALHERGTDLPGLEQATLRALAPMPEARQVICTGANYRR